MPSTEALGLHCKRCLWVINLWNSALQNQVSAHKIIETVIIINQNVHRSFSLWMEEREWKLEVEWEVPENIQKAPKKYGFHAKRQRGLFNTEMLLQKK